MKLDRRRAAARSPATARACGSGSAGAGDRAPSARAGAGRAAQRARSDGARRGDRAVPRSSRGGACTSSSPATSCTRWICISDQVVLMTSGYVVAEGADLRRARRDAAEHPMQVLIRCAGRLARVARLRAGPRGRGADPRRRRGLLVRTRDADSFYVLLNRSCWTATRHRGGRSGRRRRQRGLPVPDRQRRRRRRIPAASRRRSCCSRTATATFASKAGQLWANHFATVVEGAEQLKELGRLTLWEGAQADLVSSALKARQVTDCYKPPGAHPGQDPSSRGQVTDCY